MSEQMQAPLTPPASAPAASGGGKGLAIASLVLGILSLCASAAWWCGGPISIVGLILGALGVKSSGRGMAIAGMVLSIIGLILLVLFRILFHGFIIGNWIQNFLTSRGY